MFRRLLPLIAASMIAAPAALAQVDVNTADQATLAAVKGVGPAVAQSIVDERRKGGKFKDWTDLQRRVKGISDRYSAKLSKSGVTVNNQPLPERADAGRGDKQ
jgi:competence protein ComEA